MSTHTDDVEIGSGEAPSSVELMRARLRPRGRRGQQLVPVVQKLRPGRGRGVARGVASGGGDGEGAESREATETLPRAQEKESLNRKRRGRGRRTGSGRKRTLIDRGREERGEEEGEEKRCLVPGGEEQRQQRVGEKETDEMRENGGLKTKVYQNREMSQEEQERGEEKVRGESDKDDKEETVHIPKLVRTQAHHYLTATFSCDVSAELPNTSTTSDEETDHGSPETEYPKPSSNYQKTQRRLARQKQLEELHAREAALAREERLMRRRGLLTTPPKKADERRVMWKEEEDLVEVFQYSPCSSSRGSTLEPEDIPELNEN